MTIHNKVQPVAGNRMVPTLDRSNTHQTTFETLFDDHNDDQDSNFPLQDDKKRSEKKAFLSLRWFVITSICSLILFSAICVYLAVFIGFNQAVDELSEKVIHDSKSKIVIYIDKVLSQMSVISRLSAEQYNYGLVTNNFYRNFFYTPYKLAELSVGFAFGYPSERYSYTIVGKEGQERIVYSYQPPGFIGSIRDAYFLNGTIQTVNETVDYTVYEVSQKDFYNASINAAKSLGAEGAFTNPYIVTNGSLSIAYGALLYDPHIFVSSGAKVLKGICRTVMPLASIVKFMREKITVLKNGYVLLQETGTDLVVAGSINTTSLDEKSRVKMTDIVDKNAGQLMKDIKERFGSFENTPYEFHISSLGTNYLILSSMYTFENIQWRMFVVVFENDVQLTTTISISASVGVALLVTIISLTLALTLTAIVLRPVKRLKEQFELIKVFDLDNVPRISSSFVELNDIYNNLNNTVSWLKEIRSFIPDKVLLQLREEKAEVVAPNDLESMPSTAHHHLQRAHESSSYGKTASVSEGSTSKKQSSSASSSKEGSSVFKMGYSLKYISLLHIRLGSYLADFTPHEISKTFPKIVSVLANVTKLLQAELQITSTDEFIIMIESKKRGCRDVSQECALKIVKAFEIVNSQLKTHHMPEINFSIGISSSESNVGNIGNHSIRYYSVLSESVKVSQHLSLLALKNGLKILIDEKTHVGTEDKYITRPVDRILSSPNIHSVPSRIFNVYSLERENIVLEDEWLYELESKNAMAKIQELHGIMQVFSSSSETSSSDIGALISTGLAKLSNFMTEYPNDVACKKLFLLFEKFQDLLSRDIHATDLIKNYHCVIEPTVRPSIETHTDYRV
ncbi:hypothetical protein C9374_008984 [Naegleria lovaniensis]|uniref:Guanylate cyclase domain-containing protein n=1 Tax=Naegleria lovaniensis TaxID=51637 RepID=A0AA88GI30_NAELO|nr:uncharacterized protein C9374_008984 [Naegleria lovaniensis]KAG2377899.1 hypothetical protein C9374_008984 [Naegleria lovaniensis]